MVNKEGIEQEEILKLFVQAFKISTLKGHQMKKYLLKNAVDPNSRAIINNLYEMIKEDSKTRENWRWTAY